MDYFKNLDFQKMLHSRTMMLNALIATLLLAESNMTQLQGFLPESTYKVVAFALPFINLWLRLGTSSSLKTDDAVINAKVAE